MSTRSIPGRVSCGVAVRGRDTLKSLAEGRLDIHSGGVDLRFPHHDNEIAQVSRRGSASHTQCRAPSHY